MKKDLKSPPNIRELLKLKEPSDRGVKKPLFKKTHFTIWYFVIAFLIILLIQNYIVSKRVEDVISYSEFKRAVKEGKVKEITITDENISGLRQVNGDAASS